MSNDSAITHGQHSGFTKAMDAADRCIAKLDALSSEVSKRTDDIRRGIRENARYNRNTALIVIVLWPSALAIAFAVGCYALGRG